MGNFVIIEMEIAKFSQFYELLSEDKYNQIAEITMFRTKRVKLKSMNTTVKYYEEAMSTNFSNISIL